MHPAVLHGEGYGDYLCALKSYFRADPYRAWFGAFEPLLNGLGTSVYDGHDGVALQTDVCSPLATRPTWTGLPEDVRARLITPGACLWQKLIQELEPHLVLVSVARRYRAPIDELAIENWSLIHQVEHATPYEVFATRLRLTSGATTNVIFGRAAQTPFGLSPTRLSARSGGPRGGSPAGSEAGSADELPVAEVIHRGPAPVG